MSLDLAAKAHEIFGRYPEGRRRSALLPLLHLVQERDGFVTEQGMQEVAGILDITASEVYSVATFYSMYHLRPKGRHVVSVCHNIACSLAGAERLISRFEETLGVNAGETTADGDVTLERVECLAACDLAPMIQVDYDQMSGPLRAEHVGSIVAGLRSGSGEVQVEHRTIVPSHHEVASQRVIESEPGGTMAPETALDHHPVPAPLAFESVTEMAEPPPVTSTPVLEPRHDVEQVITPEAVEPDPERVEPGPEPVEPAEEETQPEPPPQPTTPVASEDDFVKEDEEAPVPDDTVFEEHGDQSEPPPLIDSIALSAEEEDLLRDSASRRGQQRRKYAAERLLEEPTYEGGVGPGPSDPRVIGAPLPAPSDEPEPPIRPRGAE